MANKRGRLERYGFNMTKYGQLQCSFEDNWKLGGFCNASPFAAKSKQLCHVWRQLCRIVGNEKMLKQSQQNPTQRQFCRYDD